VHDAEGLTVVLETAEEPTMRQMAEKLNAAAGVLNK